MTKEEKEELRMILNQQIGEVENEIKVLEDLTQPIPPDSAIGRISRMDAIVNRGVNEVALRKNRDRLVRLQTALGSLGKSSFGLCVKCSEPIPVGRLMLMPEATRCTRCAR